MSLYFNKRFELDTAWLPGDPGNIDFHILAMFGHEFSDFSELKLDMYIDIRFIIFLTRFDAKEIIGHYSG